MAMSRTKSLLPHTPKNLWRRDAQHDLNVIDSVGAGRVRTGSPVLSRAVTARGALRRGCRGAGWLNKPLWVAALPLSHERRVIKDLLLCSRDTSLLLFSSITSLRSVDAKWMTGGYLVVSGSC